MWKYNSTDELYHFGIKGMKWGVRRYQNEDGTLTNAGKKRYASDAVSNNWKIGENGIAVSTSKGSKGEPRYPDANKWVKEDITRTKQVTDASLNMTNQLKNAINQTNKKRKRMDLNSISDKELRERINRELLERQYNDMFNTGNVDRGKAYAKQALEIGGTVLGVTSSALAIALAIKELKG